VPGYVRGLLVPGGNIRSVRGLAYNDSLCNWPYQRRDGPSSARSSKFFSDKCAYRRIMVTQTTAEMLKLMTVPSAKMPFSLSVVYSLQKSSKGNSKDDGFDVP